MGDVSIIPLAVYPAYQIPLRSVLLVLFPLRNILQMHFIGLTQIHRIQESFFRRNFIDSPDLREIFLFASFLSLHDFLHRDGFECHVVAAGAFAFFPIETDAAVGQQGHGGVGRRSVAHLIDALPV